MKRGYICLLIALLACLIPATRALQSSGSRIRVHVTDAYGNSVPAKQITLIGDGAANEVPQDQPFSAKYGRYTLEVKVPGFSDATQSVAIDQPEQILAVAMKLGTMEASPPRCSIIGRVVPEKAALRMRSMQLFGSYSTDVPVAPDGSFEFHNLECGDYLLVTMGGKECLGTRTFRAVPTAGRADIRLTPGTRCGSVGQ
jgi:hypothetical protein